MKAVPRATLAVRSDVVPTTLNTILIRTTPKGRKLRRVAQPIRAKGERA